MINKPHQCYMRKYIPNSSFYIPFCYFGFVRMGTIAKCFGFISYFVIPTFYYFLYLENFLFISATINYLISIFLLYNLYEIGYIQNDTESIKKEATPSLRLYPRNIIFYTRHKVSIYIIRCIYSILFSLLLLFINNFSKGALLFSGGCYFVLIIFLLYNEIRSKWSIYIFCILQISKYLCFTLLFYPNINKIAIYGLILIYPLPNIIERLSFKRYNIHIFRKLLPSKRSFITFRVIYYLIIILIFIILNCQNIISFKDYIAFLYLFFFRLILLVLDKNNIKFKNYLK